MMELVSAEHFGSDLCGARVAGMVCGILSEDAVPLCFVGCFTRAHIFQSECAMYIVALKGDSRALAAPVDKIEKLRMV